MSGDRVTQLEHEISELYKWWARNAPGVTPSETGRMGRLWAELDFLYLTAGVAA